MQSIHQNNPSIAELESLRKKLKKDRTVIPIVDYGAGSHRVQQTVGDIAKSALKRTKHAVAIAQVADYIDAQSILEMGTSFGITTAYLAQKNRAVTTLEGNPHIAEIAEKHWDSLGLAHIQCKQGSFAESLPSLLQQWESEMHLGFDLIFIDGHHQGDALVSYIEQLKPCLKDGGVLICDDIHWSPDMEEAWNSLQMDAHWTASADFYEWGLLTTRAGLTKEAFSIRF
jgi:predicted O-methyltransferase YrrM